ncbi:unnamed protein product [Trichobilharzia regenti]|uniref:Hydrolase n=1 Tax=Trichobilharzia regenti TaxID=157069 RepID=A0A183W068_TRIRE|nr:unnamed protein product [Trichobilharzia regenti]VDQ02003.1 unnamed protein product [Trichobilharzia regenti]
MSNIIDVKLGRKLKDYPQEALKHRNDNKHNEHELPYQAAFQKNLHQLYVFPSHRRIGQHSEYTEEYTKIKLELFLDQDKQVKWKQIEQE